MTDPSPDVIEFVGDVRKLPDSFFMALARLILAAHDADKARAKADAEKEGAAR